MNERHLNLCWDVHWTCNYKCPYCWHKPMWDKMESYNYYPGIEKLSAVWKEVRDKYGKAFIVISGGEPLVYPGIAELLGELSSLHAVNLITNLSTDIEELLGKLGHDSDIRFGASFHPSHAEPNDFIKKAERIRESGYGITVNIVAWPPYIKKISKYRKIFKDRSFDLQVGEYAGNYGGADYPAAYSAEERRELWGTGAKEQAQNPENPGRPIQCKAGYSYAVIRPDGQISRCGGSGLLQAGTVIGNLFNPGLELLAEPNICPVDSCPCNEYSTYELAVR